MTKLFERVWFDADNPGEDPQNGFLALLGVMKFSPDEIRSRMHALESVPDMNPALRLATAIMSCLPWYTYMRNDNVSIVYWRDGGIRVQGIPRRSDSDKHRQLEVIAELIYDSDQKVHFLRVYTDQDDLDALIQSLWAEALFDECEKRGVVLRPEDNPRRSGIVGECRRKTTSVHGGADWSRVPGSLRERWAEYVIQSYIGQPEADAGLSERLPEVGQPPLPEEAIEWFRDYISRYYGRIFK